MQGVLTSQWLTLWILSVALITAHGDETLCPKGGRIHLTTQKCYWLSDTTSSWRGAQSSCKDIQRGDLAQADSSELHTFIFHSFPAKTPVWVWLKGPGGEESDQAGVLEGMRMQCSLMSLGTEREQRRAACAEHHLFLCGKEVDQPALSPNSYLLGLVFMTGVYDQMEVQPLPDIPDIGQLTVEMQLFPGLWFSHAGQLTSVDLVVQPSTESTIARVQILRPYCNPNHHLVPPGCSSLLNPFSCCSAAPLCNTTGGCSRGQYWCHLLETCVCTMCPCSPYDSAAGSRGFVLPPRYPTSPPFYHLVADLPLRTDPSSNLQMLSLLLPDPSIMVYPDDIVAVQHTRRSGTFLHCLKSEAASESPWRQSYMSLRREEWGSWWEGGLTSLPPEGRWVDGEVCDLRMLYEDNLPRGTQFDESFNNKRDESTAPTAPTAPTAWSVTNSPSQSSGLRVIYPVPDQNNEIHVPVHVPTLIVVRALSGRNSRSSWSAPVQQTGIPFLPHCPEEVAQLVPECTRRSHDVWFSSVTLVLPSEGVQTLTVSVTDTVSSQTLRVGVWSYEVVTGLSVEPGKCWRMLVETPQVFVAKVERGSSVRFTWVIDDLDEFAHEGESYSVVFKKPADYKLNVTASNPVSSQTQHLVLTADEIVPMAEPEFLLVREVGAVDAVHSFNLRVRVDVSLPVTVSWDFGDGRSNVIHNLPAPCLSMGGGLKRRQRDVYVQDAVNHTYTFPDDFKLYVRVSNQYDSTDASMMISIRPKLIHLLISSSPPVPRVGEPVSLEASLEPFSRAALFTWEFDDGSRTVQSSDRRVSHTFGSAGVFNVTVSADNAVTVLSSFLEVDVQEEISGLTVGHSGQSELNSPVDFRALVATGSRLVWIFDFGDGTVQENLKDGSISHIYKSAGKFTVEVTVSNSVSQSRQSVDVEVYRLTVSGVLPTECVLSGKDTQLRALVNGNTSDLTFHWLIGDASPIEVTGRSTTMHRFHNRGSFPVAVTVLSAVTSVSFNTSICVELGITDVTVQPSSQVAAVGEEVCFQVSVSPEEIRGCSFTWLRSSSGVITTTENSFKCFIFEDEGAEEVEVTVSNKVSNKTAKAVVSVQIPISSFSVTHDGVNRTLTVNESVSFWVSGCVGTTVSLLWSFGDDTWIHMDQPYIEVGEEMLISLLHPDVSDARYHWIVDGVKSTEQEANEFRFASRKPGVFQVQVVAKSSESTKEASVFIEVVERIEGLQIESKSVRNMKYVPTQEELEFTSSVAKGSNVTYHWLAARTSGEGKVFHMVAETPGEVLIHVKASNRLGEVNRSMSLVAVQRVVVANITNQPHVVAAGKTVNISVSVLSGSDLRFIWYVNLDVLLQNTSVPFLLHTFVSLGRKLIKVSAQNAVSCSNATMEFNIQEEVQEVEFEIDGKKTPVFVSTGAAVQLRGVAQKGSGLSWSWTLKGDDSVILKATNQTFIHTFTQAGVYQVFLNVSNEINWQQVSHSATVLDAIEGLTLNISKFSICTEEQVTFTPIISQGSNVSFVLTLQNKDRTQSQRVSKDGFTTSNLPAGLHVVTVEAWNQVSRAETSSSVLVTEQIQGLRLVNCCSADLEASKGVSFKADVDRGLPVNFTWSFLLDGSDPTWKTGQEVIFSPPHAGLLSYSVTATRGGCSKTLNETSTVHLPLNRVNIVSHSKRVFVGHAVTFSATLSGWSNISFLWDFGDSSETLSTDQNSLSHMYHNPGRYGVVVEAVSSVSRVYAQLNVEVEELQCSTPQVSLLQKDSRIFRSRPNFFEAKVENNCSVYKTTYLWEIFKESDCASANVESRINLGRKLNVNTPLLLIPKRALDVGRHCVVFTVSLQETPLVVKQRSRFTVIQSPLVAGIKGGSSRMWPSLSDLVLDGSDSKDPDVETGAEDTMEYDWRMTTADLVVKQPLRSNSSTVTLSSSQLHPGTTYVFTLTVHDAGNRQAQVNQTVTVLDAPLLPVDVECVSCSGHHRASYSLPIILSGRCEECDNETKYKWSAEDQAGVTFDLNAASTSTGRKSADLVIRSGVLQPEQSYTFSLNVSQPHRGQWGGASLTVLPNDPPHGGLCDLSPESGIRLLETSVSFSCSGWKDDENDAAQLIYTFQVSPCNQTGPKCPLLTLYRGTRSSYSSLVPMGTPGQEKHTSVIEVTVLVEDFLGAKVLALNRSLTVENPARGEVTEPWLRNNVQKELQALVQRGNPQEIISYSVALASQLNQVESGRGLSELSDRRQIHERLIQALASLPVLSLLDVDQISAALSQSIDVPREMVCSNCLEIVLKAVKKMIQIMEEQTSCGALSDVDRGGNIIRILGNTLAALSLNPQTLQSSSVVLSVLGHTRALMRSLMHARVKGEEPLSLSSPYLNAVGFHGDPSDLLCSHQSSQNHILSSQSTSGDVTTPNCRFHLPASFTSYLRSQESEVVQLLLETGPESLLAGADPPISTSLAAMELTTPQGRQIPIQDLDPEHAIRIVLPNKHPVGPKDLDGEGACLSLPLPAEGKMSFAVKDVNGLEENAGLFVSFNFSHDAGPASMNLGNVKIEVSIAAPETNESTFPLEREWELIFSASATSKEESIFLSPHSNRTDSSLLINLTSSLLSNCTVRVSVCVFSSLCQFYSEGERRWSSDGLQPLEGSTLHAAHCLTNHLTLFGASMFVHPGAVVLLLPPGGPVRNVVVGIVCAVLVLIHALMGLIAYKLDHLDRLRLSQVPLCSQPGLFHYRVLVKTGRRGGAGTTAHVGICLYGLTKSGSRHLQREGAFQRGSLDQFHLETDDNLGEIWKIRIWHDNTGLDPSWYVQHVVVWDPQTDHMFFFLVEDWLSVENQRNGSVEREVLASCPEELCQFRRVFNSQLTFGLVERHLWLSLWERPAHSRFTRCQRITCSALMLHLYSALGALWYGAVGAEGHSGPVSAQLLVNMETIAVGASVALLVFPLQCLLCFLFRHCDTQVSKDDSIPSSPACPSGDVYLCQSELSGPSFLSFADSSGQVRDSPFSLLESKLLDSSILDFWATSGLAAQKEKRGCQEDGTETWQSCDSLLSLPVEPCLNETSSAPKSLPAVVPTRLIRRKKTLMQPRRAPSPPNDPSPGCALSPTTLASKVASFNTYNHNLTTFLTLSEEDLLMSIAAASEDAANAKNSSSDSGRDSPRTTSSLSNASWSQHSEDKSLFGDVHKPDPRSCPTLFGTGLQKCPSVRSVDSVASTFLPDPSSESSRSCSSTRIGVARGKPGWLLPHWALYVTHAAVAVLLAAFLAVVGVYGSYMSRTMLIMWLVSVVSSFFSSALLLEPLKVCFQALISTALWRPVDPEVEDLLAQESTVVRAFREHCGNVRPPCGYGLLQAKEEARKVRALQSLMRHSVCQLLFLLLVLMVNYQDSAERSQGRLLHSAVRHQLHTAPLGVPNLTSLSDWSEVEQWVNGTLVPHLHQSPSLHLAGSPRLQYTHTLSPLASYVQKDRTVRTHQFVADQRTPAWTKNQLKSLSIDFTLAHRESALFVCVSIQLDWTHTHRVSPSILIHPLFIPSSRQGLDLQTALMVLLLISGLFILFRELRAMYAERSRCLRLSLFQLFVAVLSLTSAILYFCFLSAATSSVSRLWSQPDIFADFHRASLLSQRCSQSAAVLLTLLLLQLLGTLRFVRRWVVLGKVLQRAWRELWALGVLFFLLLLCARLVNMLFFDPVEGFSSVYEKRVSMLSFLCGRRTFQRPFLYGLLLVVGGFWLLVRLCGAVLIHAYRTEQAELHRPPIEPQDYEMVEFFIKRLKLWMGLTKAKEFRHRVKFEGMDPPPSRSSQESRLSSFSPFLSSPHSPSSCSSFSSQRPLSSALSVRSEDSSFSEFGTDVQPYLDHLLPCVSSLLSLFDQVNQVTEDVYDLEKKLEEAQTRRRKRVMTDSPKKSENLRDSENTKKVEKEGRETGEVGLRKTGFIHSRPRVSLPSAYSVVPTKPHNSTSIFPHTRSSRSESESAPYQPQLPKNYHTSESLNCGLNPAASPGFGRVNKRRAWHSGSSHSADAVQRNFLIQGGAAKENSPLIHSRPKSEQELRQHVRDGVPVKRKAWID